LWAGLPRDAAEFPVYSRADRRADAAVHALGLALGLVDCVGLAAAALARHDAGLVSSMCSTAPTKMQLAA
jgi:hypothetical protein